MCNSSDLRLQRGSSILHIGHPPLKSLQALWVATASISCASQNVIAIPHGISKAGAVTVLREAIVQSGGRPICMQAVVLQRCADCFPKGMIERNDFHKLLASLLGSTVNEVKQLEMSAGLTRMMYDSQCLQEDGTANIRTFVQHCFQLKDTDRPLEDESWDHFLFWKLRLALGLVNEVHSYMCPTCTMTLCPRIKIECACRLPTTSVQNSTGSIIIS